jgi:hypothetical protein
LQQFPELHFRNKNIQVLEKIRIAEAKQASANKIRKVELQMKQLEVNTENEKQKLSNMKKQLKEEEELSVLKAQ